jgi:hypothetical protein
MPARFQASAETKFLRGETGVDGAAVEEEAAPEQTEQAAAHEALYRGRTWLGREALTWALWKSESSGALCEVEGSSLKVVFQGRLLLRAGSGDITEAYVKGVGAPYAQLVRQAMTRGLLVHGARLILTHGEQQFEVTVDAERFDFRQGKLPELLTEEDEQSPTERLELVSRLSRLVDAVLAEFIKVRVSPAWKKKVVPELLEWMKAT